ncbi:hypothetical protein GPECTOR_36g100 [Gonium pectorale]|uniref:Uncharacterized protein n=1 Tax=Gonium pectorale TaxID=33097 RepID=A0A150GBL9_GONPE|nr:hypothetical protein GPECTOR_36g100 [Gonium pectorale]|eukprot:KXZ47246.1 hypothetical protein GPECTOR_36g100 [Gonium pectorale]
MFAGPDQLMLGLLAAADGSAGPASTAAALAAALGGGDADSVREWLNEQTGVVAPLSYGGGGTGGAVVSTSWLRASDVELTEAGRAALRLAADTAGAMGEGG